MTKREVEARALGGGSTRALLAYFAGLHLLVLFTLWLRAAPGVAPGVLAISVVPLTLSLLYLAGHVSRPLSGLDLWVLGYAGWSLGSVLLFMQAGNPSHVEAFAYGAYNLALPIACYFAGKAVPRADGHKLIAGLVAMQAFVAIYGLYMYFARPAYYSAFVVRSLTLGESTQEWQYFARLQSYLGSTVVGYISATGIVMSHLARRPARALLPVLLIAFTAAALLSLQRASMVALALALVFTALVSRQHRMVRPMIFIALVGAYLYGSALEKSNLSPLSERVQARVTGELVEGLQSFFQERGYRRGLSYLSAFPAGVGLGATSSAADNAGYLTEPEVSDANYMRIAADLGPLGLGLFLAVLCTAFLRAKSSSHPAAWITFLLIHAGVMLSTNIMDSYYVSQSFWVLLGILDNDRVLSAPAASDILPS